MISSWHKSPDYITTENFGCANPVLDESLVSDYGDFIKTAVSVGEQTADSHPGSVPARQKVLKLNVASED